MYLIKGCAGTNVNSMRLGRVGPLHDRWLMITDTNGRMVTQRTHPRLALVHPRLEHDMLTVMAPNGVLKINLDAPPQDKIEVRVWNDYCAGYRCSAKADEFFSDFLGMQCRLVRQRFDDVRTHHSDTLGEDFEVSYADAYPLLVLSQEALDTLNDRLVTQKHSPVDSRRFRPNIVLSGCRAHEEDTWRGFQSSPGTRFQNVKRCVRCSVPDVDPQTGERDPNRTVTKTLLQYRQAKPGEVIFGSNYLHRNKSLLRVGDPVEPISP